MVVVDGLPARLALAEKLGAVTVNFRETDPVAAVAELTGGGADFVFDATGSTAGAASAPGLARGRGSVTIIGWPEKATFPFPIETIIDKELDLHGTNR